MTAPVPDVTLHNRDIPSGQVLLAECGTVSPEDPRPQITVLDTKTAWGRTVELVACTAGWAIAGSCLRWDNGWYGIRFEFDGSTHQRRHGTYEQAKNAFDNLPS